MQGSHGARVTNSVSPRMDRTSAQQVETPHSPAAAQPRPDPMGLERDSLLQLERELQSDKPAAAALCRAADVLMIEGRFHDAVAVLFWGTLKYANRPADHADHILLTQGLTNALLHSAQFKEAVKLTQGIEGPESKRLYGLAYMLYAASLPGPEGRALMATVENALRAKLAGARDSIPQPGADELPFPLLAMVAYSRGNHPAAVDALGQVPHGANRINACIWMRRLDEAFDLIDDAIARGDSKLLSEVWRSPLLKELRVHARFDSFAARSGVTELRSGNTRLTVPGRMLYGRGLALIGRLQLLNVRKEVFHLQSLLDQHGPVLHPYNLFDVAETLQRERCFGDAEALLRWAIQKYPDRGETKNLKMRLAEVLIHLNRPWESHQISAQMPLVGQNGYHASLAMFYMCETNEQLQKLGAELDDVLADPRSFVECPDAQGAKDKIYAIKAAILYKLNDTDGAQETLSLIQGPVQRMTALLWMNQKEAALDVLNALVMPEINGVWNCPNIFDLEGEPGWNAFLLRAGVIELDSGDLRLKVPHAMLQVPPPGHQPIEPELVVLDRGEGNVTFTTPFATMRIRPLQSLRPGSGAAAGAA